MLNAEQETGDSLFGKKICAKCECPRLLTSYYKSSRNRDGLGYYCKFCADRVVYEWKEKHPAKVKYWASKRCKEKYWEDPDKARAINRVRFQKIKLLTECYLVIIYLRVLCGSIGASAGPADC